MRVLLTGAHGLIGSALLAQLGADGHQVVTLDRPSSERRSPGNRAGSVAWDPKAGTLDRRELGAQGPFEAVVHLAGAGIGDRRWSSARRAEILDSRIAASSLLAETLASSSPRPGVLVSASAVGFYGDRGQEVLTEESAAGRGFLAEVCREWESAVQPAAEAGIRVVTIRSGIVLSPSGGILARLLPLFRLGLGARLGDGRQYVSWITLPDEIAGIRRAIDESALEGPVNLVAPDPVTNAVFTQAVARAVRRPAVLRVPRAALALALGADMADELLLASQRVLPSRLTSVGHVFAHPELDGALSAVLSGR